MTIGGVSIILILGILNLLLLVFQISSGKRWIKVPFALHRKGAMVLFVSAVLHSLLAFLAT